MPSKNPYLRLLCSNTFLSVAAVFLTAIPCFQWAIAQSPPTHHSEPRTIEEAIKQAKADQKAGRFAEGIHLMETWRTRKLTAEQKKQTGIALADFYFYQARAFERAYKMEDAILAYQSAYSLDKVQRHTYAAADLNNIGSVYLDLGQFQKALDNLNHALSIGKELKDRRTRAVALDRIGQVYFHLGQPQKALEYLNQALTIKRAMEDRHGEAYTLNNIGIVYSKLGQPQKALERLNQALPIQREVKDRRTQAVTLDCIGQVHFLLGQPQKALEFYNQALLIEQEVKDRHGEAISLDNIGLVYSYLGQPQKALEFYNLALHVAQEVSDPLTEATSLNNIGGIYLTFGEPENALIYLNQALRIDLEVKDRRGEAITLSNIGLAYSYLGQPQKALEFYKQVLPIQREVKDRRGEATTLNNIGEIYSKMGQPQKALEFYNQALPIEQEVKDRIGEADTLGNLMWLLDSPQQRPLAIFYGKQSVNLYQAVRADIQGLEKESQQAFLKKNEDTYHKLADLLITEGRLPEAQQVLNLIKQQEFFDFVRRDESQKTDINADLTAREADWEKRYRLVADRVTEIGTQCGELENNRLRTAAEDSKLKSLRADLETANRAFQAFLQRIAVEFSSSTKSNTLGNLKDTEALSASLASMPRRTLAVYTLVGEKTLRFLIITGQTQVAREYPIGSADLNKKIAEFRSALQDPRRDPRPAGKALYDILIKPIEGDLAGAKAETVMWSLDGALRYLPFAALWDGKQYVVEKWSSPIFTPASMTRLEHTPASTWTALGVGVSKPHAGFDPLPGVPDELRGIIHSGDSAGQTGGPLPGTILLDEQFTRDSLDSHLDGRTSLVHIAGHFAFHPGDETQSFLLLGDGSHLTLEQIKSLRTSLFRGVDLLTLSCCETAMGSGEKAGAEVEGFGVLAQRKGADAVLATLWPVADHSTEQLMRAFYTIRQSHPELTKIEALRHAQISLLHGTIKDDGPEPPRGTANVNPPAPGAYASNPKAPCSHPYYWAPFILIGNWK